MLIFSTNSIQFYSLFYSLFVMPKYSFNLARFRCNMLVFGILLVRYYMSTSIKWNNLYLVTAAPARIRELQCNKCNINAIYLYFKTPPKVVLKIGSIRTVRQAHKIGTVMCHNAIKIISYEKLL